MANRPNLFEYAPGELSQDAFICWLVDWVNFGGELGNCARNFLAKTIDENIDPQSITNARIIRQHLHIDVLIVVDILGRQKKSAIILEDKTRSIKGKNQIVGYWRALEEKGIVGKRDNHGEVLNLTPDMFTQHVCFFKTGPLSPFDTKIPDSAILDKTVYWNYKDSVRFGIKDKKFRDLWSGFFQAYHRLIDDPIFGDFCAIQEKRGEAWTRACHLADKDDLPLKEIRRCFLENGIRDPGLWFIECITRDFRAQNQSLDPFVDNYRGVGQCGLCVRAETHNESQYGDHTGFLWRGDDKKEKIHFYFSLRPTAKRNGKWAYDKKHWERVRRYKRAITPEIQEEWQEMPDKHTQSDKAHIRVFSYSDLTLNSSFGNFKKHLAQMLKIWEAYLRVRRGHD